jgi:hypothetical protein
LTSDAVVFQFDPATREVTRTVTAVDKAAKDIWGIGSLFFAADGRLYGSSGGWVFSIDPRRGTPTTLDRGRYAAADNAGRIYYAQGPELLRMTV